ncbi:hypothetical protein [Billgrantia desiderata]|uniref:hypothetical protein n=1 Tax=Billgrantia desiderata TaxID=52021 RepID=UPI001F28EDEB|nr:hypothetical protein [Halomonas desiderata]
MGATPRARQGAAGSGLADGGIQIGKQHRGIQREEVGIGLRPGGHQADDGRGDGTDRA